MFKNEKGETILETDARLQRINIGEPVVTEGELKDALKAYNLRETLLALAELSKNIFNRNIPKPYELIGTSAIRHPEGVIVAQFGIEYLANIFIISGANDFKSESVKNKDNLLGLFNIYNNSVIRPRLNGRELSSMLVPMSFVQFRSQFGLQNLLVRQWMIFSVIRKKIGTEDFEDLDNKILNSTNLTIEEILGLSFSVFSLLINNPLFNIGNLDGSTVESLKSLLTSEKIGSFLKLYAATYLQIRELDRRLNPQELNEFTTARFNPLWKKPILQLAENLFLVPSLTAYATANFYGLFWWFDDYYRSQSKKRQMDFRKYFGLLFENYSGEVIKDLYGEEAVRKQVKYGPTEQRIDFTDWAAIKGDKVYLFEAKANQFPLEVLQKGNPDDIRKEVVNKIVQSIKQIFERARDIPNFKELSEFNNKKIIPIVLFYDIPLVSSHLYEKDLFSALTDLNYKYPGIKDFPYYLLGIQELEDFYYCSDSIELEDILEKIKNDPIKGFSSELVRNIKDKERKNFLDRQFKIYLKNLVPDI